MTTTKSITRERNRSDLIYCGVGTRLLERMMNKEEYLEAKRYQLELILLGFALASTGDRGRILKEINADDMRSQKTRECFEAIARKDTDGVRSAFSAIVPVLEGKTVLESLMQRIADMDRDRAVRNYLAGLLAAIEVESIDDVQNKLTEAMEYVRSQ